MLRDTQDNRFIYSKFGSPDFPLPTEDLTNFLPWLACKAALQLSGISLAVFVFLISMVASLHSEGSERPAIQESDYSGLFSPSFSNRLLP